MTKHGMTGEQFLNSIKGLDCEIDALDFERVRLEEYRLNLLEKAESMSANLTGVCVQQAVSSKTETLGVALASGPDVKSLVSKLNEYQALINEKIDDLVNRKCEALRAIGGIQEPRHKALLTYRYIGELKWATIADLLGYTEDYVRREMKDAAIAAFECVWQLSETSHKTPQTFDVPV